MKADDTIFLVAPGPSIGSMDLSGLKGRRVIGIKRGFKWAPWCEAVFSTHPHKFYVEPEVLSFREAHPDCAFYAMGDPREGTAPAWVTTLRNDRPRGLCKDPTGIGFGANSGHGGMNVAYHRGPPERLKRMVLLGYDMRLVDGRSHADREEANTPPWQYRNIMVPSFFEIAQDLAAEGIEVLNATPGSKLEIFPRANLEDLV